MESDRRKRPEVWTNNTWMQHHDNGLGNAPVFFSEFLTKHDTTVVPQAPHTSDMAPTEFFLFTKLKPSLKCCGFKRVVEIEEHSIRDFSATSQNTFQYVFQNWKIRWEKCV
jgi:hypothetical protein